MAFNNTVDSFNGEFPSIKKSLTDRLKIGVMLEDVYYKIQNIDYEVFGLNERQNDSPPKIGETICIHYDFYKHDLGPEYGYEHLVLFIGRLDQDKPNYVRYFKNIDQLNQSILGLNLVLDTDFANEQILRLRHEIEKYTKDYEIGIDSSEKTDGLDKESVISLASVPAWVAEEIKATWKTARNAGGELEAFRIIERMVDRLGYGRIESNHSLANGIADSENIAD